MLGLGNVGEFVAVLLTQAGFTVSAFDIAPQPDLAVPGEPLDVHDAAALRTVLLSAGAVVSCLPYHANPAVAEAAAEIGVRYFDLTEDVRSTAVVRSLADTAGRAMVPQCGLAPGLIGIVGTSLTDGFDEVRSIELKVGALPRNPSGLLGYAFLWSPEGVVNEYLNDCEVIRDHKRQLVPPMEALEPVVIGGTLLEAFHTSGGLGTMCETWEGRVERLDYKTLRYPGHCQLMRFVFDELRLREERELAGRILVAAKPPVDDDVVYLHAAVEGTRRGKSFRAQHVRCYEPIEIAGRMWRAISWTTAASACGVVELVAGGRLPDEGFVRQEDVPYADLLSTESGSLLA